MSMSALSEASSTQGNGRSPMISRALVPVIGSSGLGGEGGAGGAGGAGGMPLPLGEFNALAPGAEGTLTLPAWMSIACPTAGRTAQTSATTVKTGFAANAARGQSRDGTTWGLMVENQRINEQERDSEIDDAAWIKQMKVAVSGVNTVTDPAGGMTADQVTWTTAPNSKGFFGNNPGGTINGTFTASHWLKWAAGMGTVELQNAATGNANATVTPTTDWARFGWTTTTAGDVRMAEWIRKTMSSPDLIDHWGCQVELGKYPTSLIPTAASDAERKADVLSITQPGMLMPNGYFDMTLRIAPAYAAAETAGDHQLLFLDVNNNLMFRQSDAKIVLTINSVAVASDALTFSRHQALTIHAIHSAATLSVEVAGATTGNGIKTGIAQPALTVPGTVFLLGNGSGAQEAADLQMIEFL